MYINFYGYTSYAMATQVMQYPRRVGRPEFVQPEEKKAKADSNLCLQLPVLQFGENGARLLVVSCNERRDIGHNFHERMFQSDNRQGENQGHWWNTGRRALKGLQRH